MAAKKRETGSASAPTVDEGVYQGLTRVETVHAPFTLLRPRGKADPTEPAPLPDLHVSLEPWSPAPPAETPDLWPDMHVSMTPMERPAPRGKKIIGIGSMYPKKPR